MSAELPPCFHRSVNSRLESSMLVQVVQQLNRGAPLTLAASAFAWAESYLRLRHPQANPRARSRRAHLPLRPRRLLARARWREGAGDFRASNLTRVARSSPARNERLKGNSSAILHVRTAQCTHLLGNALLQSGSSTLFAVQLGQIQLLTHFRVPRSLCVETH